MNPAAIQHASRNELRIMILDDHALSRQALFAAFRSRGYQCLAVETPDEAVASIETFAPHVVIMEWAFRPPAPIGIGLAARLRACSVKRGQSLFVVVVLLRGAPDDGRRNRLSDGHYRRAARPYRVPLDRYPTRETSAPGTLRRCDRTSPGGMRSTTASAERSPGPARP